MKKKIVICMVLVMVSLSAQASEYDRSYWRYDETIKRTASMVSDRQAQDLAGRYGLRILDLTWEDTGRYKNSSVGPNISDMTIQVQHGNYRTGEYTSTCMPVIRYPNFSDKTGDISPDDFYLLVGNEKGGPLRRVTLTEYLGNFRDYLHDPYSWKGRGTSLLARRDSHVLVSAQACFLPISEDGTAEFNPVLFNYQSYQDSPAVLTILATREGTSATIIDNKRDGFSAGRRWGQRLFFNQDGERASLTGERITDFLSDKENIERYGSSPSENAGLNMVLLIQVPLKQKRIVKYGTMPVCESLAGGYDQCVMCKRACSDVENAVIGHGDIEGPFTEIDNLMIERDPRYPIRVTVQFYKATSNGVVSASDMAEIAEQIKKVYNKADYVGSLVTSGYTHRPTEYTGGKVQPPYWWKRFWRRHDTAPEWGLVD